MKNIFINMLLTPFLKLRHYKLELSFFSCQTKVTHPKRVFCYCFIVVIVTDRNHYGRVHTCFYLYPYLTTFTKNTACTRVRWHMFLFLIFFVLTQEVFRRGALYPLLWSNTVVTHVTELISIICNSSILKNVLSKHTNDNGNDRMSSSNVRTWGRVEGGGAGYGWKIVVT